MSETRGYYFDFIQFKEKDRTLHHCFSPKIQRKKKEERERERERTKTKWDAEQSTLLHLWKGYAIRKAKQSDKQTLKKDSHFQ